MTNRLGLIFLLLLLAACSSVAGGMTIIVGLWDRNGQRLVRLTPR